MGSGLESPATAQTGCSSLLDRACDGENLVFALDGAGSGNDADVSSADAEIADLYAGGIGLGFETGDLVGRQDGDDLFDLIVRFQGFPFAVSFFTDGGNHGSLGTFDEAGAIGQAAVRAAIQQRHVRPTLCQAYSDALARRTFRYSIVYLFLLFALLLLDHYLPQIPLS